MEKLDQKYLTDLVRKAQSGSSNAAAELYAAVCRRIYAYLYILCKNREKTGILFQDIVTQTLSGLQNLTDADLFLPWIARKCVLRCSELSEGTGSAALRPDKEIDTPEGRYTAAYLLNLPLTESQVLLMRYGQGMTEQEIGDVLNFSRSMTRTCLKSGRRHLRGETEGSEGGRFSPHRRKSIPLEQAPELEAVEAARILEESFTACGQEPNTVPLEALSAYAVYRKERFFLQRRVLTGLLILFLLLPLCFLLPRMEVEVEDAGERGLPVYTIRIGSLLPVSRVTAKVNARSLPVYEAGARLYTVEPTRNGSLTLTVELVNRQQQSMELPVTAVDGEAPKLKDSEIGEETVLLRVEDSGIGIDYAEIAAITESGMTVLPLQTDEAAGEILFSYPEENWDVYIPDHIGNTLHLSLTLE